MTKQALLQLLAENQMPDLFTALKSRQGYYNDLILLEGQWNDLRSKQRNGIIPDEQANLEIARIRKNLLDLIEITFAGHREVAGATIYRPAAKPAFAKLAMAGGLALILVIVFFAVLRSSGTGAATAFSKADTHPTLPVNNPALTDNKVGSNAPASEKANVKILEIPGNPITLNKGRIGDITYKLLSAELSEQNPDNWLLRIKARIIKPAYGAVVNSCALHIAYGDFEKIPVHIDFPGIAPGTTEEGVAEFEVPKTYTEVKLLIYPLSYDPPGATIPIKL